MEFNNVTIPAAVLFVFCLVVVLKSTVMVPADRRAAVYRLGRFVRILRPGLHIRMPIIDLVKSINLNEKIPGWKGMTPEQLDAKVEDVILNHP